VAEKLLSVGLDVGTTTTQLILSELEIENAASGFTVPKMQITGRSIRYRSPVWFTPLLGQDKVDGEGIRELVKGAYRDAGVEKSQIDTGAIIITGETSRKENAAAVLAALSGFAGDFVAATAGPDLESVLAAKGSGAAAYSKQTGKTVLHMDIGGGTSNLALIREGNIVRTGCLNIGGRLLKFAENGQLSYVSPVLEGLTDLEIGDHATPAQVERIADMLTRALEMAAGLRPATELLSRLTTKETGKGWPIPEEEAVISFSGGVADCIDVFRQPGQFGDMGVELGQAIRKSRLCAGEYMLGKETIRATVIGAGSHSAQLSGSTVFYRGITLPLKNLPVAVFSPEEQLSPELPALIRQRIKEKDAEKIVLALPGFSQPDYAAISSLADRIAAGVEKQVLICVETDMAKALGQALSLRLPEGAACLCIDRVQLSGESFLDIGKPVGPALPVVVKTLVLEKQ